MKIHYLLMPLLCAGMAFTQSCSNDDLQVEQTTHTESIVKVHLSLGCVGTAASAMSRADGTPDHEEAYDNERYIDKVRVFVYDTPMNCASTSNAGTVRYFDISNSDMTLGAKSSVTGHTYDRSANIDGGTLYYLDRYYTVDKTVELSLSAGNFYAVAVANVSDSFKPTTVLELRNAVISGGLYTASVFNENNGTYTLADATHPANGGVKGYGKFVMAGVNEVKFTVTGGESSINITPDDGSEPLLLQRLAARIDIAFGTQATVKKNDGGQELDSDGNVWTEGSGKEKWYEHIDDADANGRLYDVETLTNSYYRFPVYTIVDGNEVRISGAHFDLQTIKIINGVSASTMFEQASIGGSPYYLGNEGGWTGGYANNFVLSYGERTWVDRVLASTTGTNPVGLINSGIRFKGNDVKWGVYSTIGYVGENTFSSYANTNKYTAIYLEGESNIDEELTSASHGDDHCKLSGAFNLRHSFGTANTAGNMCYGVVRNTIYRIHVKFFVQGTQFFVRWYHRAADNSEIEYEDVPFYQFIIDSDDAPND